MIIGTRIAGAEQYLVPGFKAQNNTVCPTRNPFSLFSSKLSMKAEYCTWIPGEEKNHHLESRCGMDSMPTVFWCAVH